MFVSRSAAALFLDLAICASSSPSSSMMVSAKSLRARRTVHNVRADARVLKRPEDEFITLDSHGDVEEVVKIKGKPLHAGPKPKVDDVDDGPDEDVNEEDPSLEDEPEENPDDGPDDGLDEPSAEDPLEADADADEPSAEDPISAEDPEDAWDGDWELTDVDRNGDGIMDACVLLPDGDWATVSLTVSEFGDLSISQSVEGTCAEICATSEACHCEDVECELVSGVNWTDFIQL